MEKLKKGDKLGLRVGHSINCMGAIGYCNEYLEQVIVFKELCKIIRERGIEVVECNSSANTQTKELMEGVKKANDQKVKLNLSLHMNSVKDPNAKGVECVIFNSKSDCLNLANDICLNISRKGFFNRGVKFNSGLYETKNTNMPHIIVETCFVSNNDDVNKFWKVGHHEIALCIADAITEKPVEENKRIYKVQVGAFTNKVNAENLVNELKKYGYSPFITE